MASILWQEGKRLCTKNILCFYGICIMVGLFLSYIISYQMIYYASNNTYIRGPEAIEELQKHTITRDFTSLWKESYEMLHMVSEDPTLQEDAHGLTAAGFQKLQSYQDIIGIQEMLFKDIENLSPSVEDMTNIRLVMWRNRLSKQGIPEDKTEKFLGERTSSSIPDFEASIGIRTALTHLPYIMILLMIFFTITLSSLYARDRYTHIDVLVLSTKYGRKKDILLRIVASLLYVTLLYGIAILVYTLYSIFVLHMQKSNTPFYLTKDAFFSYETLSYTAAYGKAILMGYVGILGISSVSICISALSKRREFGILLSLGIALFPISPLSSTLPETIQVICSSTLTQAVDLFNSLHVHMIFQHIYMESDTRLLCNGILICIFLGIAIGMETTYATHKGLRL